MQLTAVILLLFVALTATAHPHPSTQLLRIHHFDHPESEVPCAPANSSALAARASNGLCSTLELPTEGSYKTGYTQFCTKYVSDSAKKVLSTNSAPLVATYMLPTHTKVSIPWIFKIHGPDSGSQPYLLTQQGCIKGFRDILESKNAKLGGSFCVVGGTGGDGESKKFWDQGFVLVKGGDMTFREGTNGNSCRFETRRRKGEFDPKGPDGKK